MKRRDVILIENYYREYYYRNTDAITKKILSLESREFAYIDFNDIMKRHIAIRMKNFKKWVLENIPKHFYHSSAYYMFPEKEMDSKGWEGADLVFDIDLDHIAGYEPRKIIICKEDKSSIVVKSEVECSGERRELVFLEEEGLSVAKKELLNLLETLSRDLDIKIGEMQIYFSGARGYHVHIDSERFLKLDSYARMEIKDYLTFDGIDIKHVKSVNSRPMVRFFNAILNSDERLNKIFSPEEIKFLKDLSSRKDVSIFAKEIKQRKNIIEKANRFISMYLGIQIDGVVTVDTSRLIRVPYSLHGKTGLVKTPIEYTNIDSFNPFSDAVKKEEEKIKLKILYCPKIFWYDKEYGPYYEEEAIVPFSLGIYLTVSGLAYEIRKYE